MDRIGETTSGVHSARLNRERVGMRTVVTGVLGLIAGFVAGIWLFDRGLGVDPQPIVLAIACAVAATVANVRVHRGPR